jgi:hypothetical protein
MKDDQHTQMQDLSEDDFVGHLESLNVLHFEIPRTHEKDFFILWGVVRETDAKTGSETVGIYIAVIGSSNMMNF